MEYVGEENIGEVLTVTNDQQNELRKSCHLLMQGTTIPIEKLSFIGIAINDALDYIKQLEKQKYETTKLTRQIAEAFDLAFLGYTAYFKDCSECPCFGLLPGVQKEPCGPSCSENLKKHFLRKAIINQKFDYDRLYIDFVGDLKKLRDEIENNL